VKSLVLVAHGSRIAASNEEVCRLAGALGARVADRYQRVEAAFLELARPSIGEAVDMAVAAGAASIVVLPYFLAAGKHVSHDIPAIVKSCQAAHPDIEIRMADYLGSQPTLVELLARIV
jgi:sirohydrochlorin ferrochelatase